MLLEPRMDDIPTIELHTFSLFVHAEKKLRHTTHSRFDSHSGLSLFVNYSEKQGLLVPTISQ